MTIPLPAGPAAAHELQVAETILEGAPGAPVVLHGSAPRKVIATYGDHLNCPRRGTRARDEHDANIEHWAERLRAVGFTDVTIARCGALGTLPIPEEPQTIAHVFRGPLGTFRSAVRLYDERGRRYDGEIPLHFEANYASARYTATSLSGKPIPIPPTATATEAVWQIADWYGLPQPVHVVWFSHDGVRDGD